MTSSFDALLTETAGTRRAAISGGKRGEPTAHLAGLACTPLDPVDPETRHRLAIETPHQLLQTFVGGDPDVKQDDVLVVGGVDYPIKSVASWQWGADVFVHLIVEKLVV